MHIDQQPLNQSYTRTCTCTYTCAHAHKYTHTLTRTHTRKNIQQTTATAKLENSATEHHTAVAGENRIKCPKYHNATATTTLFPLPLHEHNYNYHMTAIRETTAPKPCDISKLKQPRKQPVLYTTTRGSHNTTTAAGYTPPLDRHTSELHKRTRLRRQSERWHF